jgi:hypothetical protein
MTYTPSEHRRALRKLLGDIKTMDDLPCPECPEVIEFHEGEPADPTIGVHATHPGYYCSCGWSKTFPPPEKSGGALFGD